VHYEFFDPNADFTIYYRRLPHWDQPGTVCFISWRTVDSIPAEVLQRWRVERAIWLRAYEIDPQTGNWREQLKALPVEARQDYHRQFTSPWMECLDECHGACVLKQRHLSGIVAESLLHQNGDEYEISDFVVMPNHVHVLAQFRSEGGMRDCCQSWKHYTARRINVALNQSGQFWQWESFDHLVRSAEQFEYLRGYIERNPIVANLRQGEFRHYRK